MRGSRIGKGIFIGGWGILLLLTIISSDKNELPYQKSGRMIIIETKNSQMEIDMEQFIPLVLMAEFPYESPKELLKAQSVVLRTNILYAMKGKKRISAKELGFPYKMPEILRKQWEAEEKMGNAGSLSGILLNTLGIGGREVFAKRMNSLYRTVSETEGRVLKIEGKVILPLFHRLSNGTTRDGAEHLGENYCYLSKVRCDEDMENPSYEAYNKLNVTKIFEQLNSHGIVAFEQGKEMDFHKISGPELVEMLSKGKKDQAGYWEKFVLGDISVEGVDFARALGLQSCAFDMEAQGDEIVFSTRGIGHGFGMSLNSAKEMALEGKHYEEILKKFYQAALVKSFYFDE